MAMRICFLNPFGTPDYDAIITQTLAPSLRSDTDVEVRHLENAPRNIDYYVPKHLVEIEILKAVLAAAGAGHHPGDRPAGGRGAARSAVRSPVLRSDRSS